ncbi:MAG: hypothetical protein M3O23_07525 [Actinomycetota bacterium]|nr:hypothetical protein [Actinomycetota bacterium]
MAVRLQFIPRKEPPDLLDLPWDSALTSGSSPAWCAWPPASAATWCGS